MKKSVYTVGQYLVDRLEEIGVDHLFAIPGDYCADWVHKYLEPSNITRISPTNELNAGYAADGYARLKGIGAVCVTYSVGAFSLLNAVAGSFTEKVPVVVINGAPSIAKRIQFRQQGLQFHHMINGHGTDLNIYRNVTVAAERIENAQLAPRQIDTALEACLTYRQPVYLETLEDIYDQPCDRPRRKLKVGRMLSEPTSLKNALSSTLDRLKAAKRPLIWAGVEIERYGLQKTYTQLLDTLQIPYVSSYMGKAAISEDNPYYVGVFEGKCTLPAVAATVENADFILALGTWYTDINSLGEINLPWEKMSFAGHYAVRQGVDLAPQVALEDFMEGIMQGARKMKLPKVEIERPKRDEQPIYETDQITYQGFYDYIERFIDPKMIVMGGTGFNLWGSVLLEVTTPDGFITQSAYTDIGYVTPASVGAAFAKPKQRVVVFAGDGGFQMTAQSISSMARYKQDNIIFLLNNNVYGIEQWLADPAVFGNDDPFLPLAEIARWNYSELPHAFGDNGRGWKVETYGELEKATKEALAHRDGPSLIQVVVPPKSLPALAEWKVPKQ